MKYAGVDEQPQVSRSGQENAIFLTYGAFCPIKSGVRLRQPLLSLKEGLLSYGAGGLKIFGLHRKRREQLPRFD